MCEFLLAGKLELFKQTLRRRLGGQCRNLRIAFRDGSVVLQGTMGTYYGKQFAQHVARDIYADYPLVNEIEVRQESETPEMANQ